MTDDGRFRLGLVGAGKMGRTHLRSIAGSATVRVAGIAEPSPAVRAELAQAGHVAHADIAGLLRDGGLDGLLIAVPTRYHLAVVAQLVPAGLPLLCEKPCGLTPDEARQAADLAASHGVKLRIAYYRRFVPELQALRARIVAGELGEIYHIACHQWDAEPSRPEFRATSGGMFVNMGVHEFDQIRWLTGQELTGIHTVMPRATTTPGEVESAQALCTLSGGATALVNLGQRYPHGDVAWVEVFGTRDTADCRFLWPPDPDAAFHHALRRQAEGFAAWVRGGPDGGAAPADAVAALEAAAATPG